MTDATIHIRTEAARKGRWIRESRGTGMTLADWIIAAVEGSMIEQAPKITPETVRTLRSGAGHTQTEASRTVWRTMRTWQDWESGARTPDAGLIELYCIKTRQVRPW